MPTRPPTEMPFGPIIDHSPLDNEGAKAIRAEIEDAVRGAMSDPEISRIEASRKYVRGGEFKVVRQTDIASALGYSKNRVLRVESGNADASVKYRISLRMLRDLALKDPRAVAEAALAGVPELEEEDED